MKPAIVVDVGNSRIKWGRCSSSCVAEISSLPPEDPGAWQRQLNVWQLAGHHPWAVSGVHPLRIKRFVDWVHGSQGARTQVVDCWRQLPLSILVEQPEQVGLDRLLNAVAANSVTASKRPAVIVDAGTAITVDFVDHTGSFRGGAIMPGMRLMAKALHDCTALLPQVDLGSSSPPQTPAATTQAAMQAGIFWAAAGGVRMLVRQMADVHDGSRPPQVFLTGGDANLLSSILEGDIRHWPEMTLQGIRLAAEALP